MNGGDAQESAGGGGRRMSTSDRSPYVLAAVLLVIVLSWGVVDLVRGNHGPLVLGGDLAIGLAVAVVTVRCRPRRR